jgi:hypothetical protein
MTATTPRAQVAAHLAALEETRELLSDPVSGVELHEARVAIEAGTTVELTEWPRR